MQVGEIMWHVQGDIGGVGVSRLRFVRQDSAAILGADCNAAAAATHGLFAAAGAYTPNVVSWACQPQVDIYDSASGIVAGPLVVTSLPSPVTGTGGANFAAGTGARLNWKTSTLSGRRLLKGALYLVPFATTAMTTSGGISSAMQTAMNNAANAYLIAMEAALLYPVVWHRPAKGASSGGLTGGIYAGILSATPSSLRTRRH